MATTGGAAAAAAAAAARRRAEEEEEMTGYSEQELRGEWEFKILRAHTRAFKKPEVLQQVCEEEAKAGWMLVEKFDDCRLRFKRPLSARARDAALSGDAYRTHYGTSQGAIAALVLLGVVFLVLAIILFTVIGGGGRPH